MNRSEAAAAALRSPGSGALRGRVLRQLAEAPQQGDEGAQAAHTTRSFRSLKLGASIEPSVVSKKKKKNFSE